MAFDRDRLQRCLHPGSIAVVGGREAEIVLKQSQKLGFSGPMYAATAVVLARGYSPSCGLTRLERYTGTPGRIWPSTTAFLTFNARVAMSLEVMPPFARIKRGTV